MQMKTIKNTKFVQENPKFNGKRNKGGKPAAKYGRKETYKSSQLCGREFMGWITI